jgi:hypothetical protein
MKLSTTALAIACIFAHTQSAHAQAFSRLGAGEQTVTVETGMQSGVVGSVGYAAGLRVPVIDRTIMPLGQITVVQPDPRNLGLRGGAQIGILDVWLVDISAQLALEVERGQNSICTATALRSDLVFLVGHYWQEWFVTAELGYDHAWLTYLKGSNWYRTYFYSGFKDGWYRNTAGNLRYGLKGGMKLWNDGLEIVLRAGKTVTENLNPTSLPFYATLGVGYRF